MREKTMKKGHLLLTLLAFVCLMGLGTIHANAATVKAKVDVKKFYGMAEQVLQEINRQRRNNGLSELKMDANFTEVAMNIALQKQGGDASASNPEIYNNVYVRKDAMEIDDIDGYDEYSDNLWKETRNGKEKILNHIKKVGTFLYKESDITSKIGIGVVATDAPQGIPRELNYGGFCNVTYCFISNEVGHDDTNYNPYVNNGKTVRTQMDLYIDSSNTYLIVDANENCLTPKYTYDVIKKGEKRKAHPGVWQHPVIFGKVHNELCRFKCKLSNTGASWSSSDSSVVSVDSNGNITAKKNGIATVTVKVGSLQATKKYVVSDVIGMDTDTLLYLPNWKSKSDIPKEYTGNCYAGGYALEVKNGRITWSKNMKTNKITRPGSKKSTVKTKKLKGSYYKIISKSKRTVQYMTIDSRSESLGHSQGSGNLQMSKAGMKLMTPGQISRMPKNDCILFLKGERPIYDKKNWPFNTEVFKEAEKIAGQNGYKNPVYVSYDERNKKYITTRFESRLNYISKEEFTFFEEKAKEDSSIQTFQIDEEAFLYLNFNETPQPSLRELEKMVKEIQVAEVNEEEEEEEKETDQQPDMLQDREQWDLSGDIIDCFRRYSSELSPEEQEEIIKGIEEGMTDQDVKRYFTLVGAEKMRQYRRVLMVAKIRDEDN